MKIVSTFFPSREIQEEQRTHFPMASFKFFKNKEEAAEELISAEICLTYGEDLTEEDIYRAENLKWIMVMSAGMEKMPFKACSEREILVTNARGIHKIPMAEFTVGAMLQHVKSMKELWQKEQKEEWDRKVPMEELNGKTVLILGIGAIGNEIARLLQAFNMTVIGINRSGEESPYAHETYIINKMEEVLHRADFLVSILPSTPETIHLLKENHFDLMKSSSVFINIGRGNLVDEATLLNVMGKRKIAHAYLDVFENEPLSKGHPFWKMENITVTPHLSSITKGYQPRSFEIFNHNLHTYINKNDDFINVIDLKRGY